MVPWFSVGAWSVQLLMICSVASVESGWVEDEVAAAFAEAHKRGETVLFPIRIDDAVLKTEKPWAARIRNRLHIGDFTQWKDRNAYERALERLLRDQRMVNNH
jgi:hypothetical protein